MTTYFVLQPAHWPGASTYLCRPLIGPRHEKANVPWVSVARSRAYGDFALVRRDEVSGDEARALVAEADTWIAGNQRTWQVIAKSGVLFWKRPSMVRVLNPSSPAGLTKNPMDDLACEQIVSLKAMLDASGELDSLDLAVAIPKRGWLVAGVAQPGELLKVQELHAIAQGVGGRADPDDVIDPHTVYFLKAGTLIGRSVNDGKSGYVSLSRVDETAWNYPATERRYTHAEAEAEVLALVERGQGRWGWKDIANLQNGPRLPAGYTLPAMLRALEERGAIEAYTDENGHTRYRRSVGGFQRVQRMHAIGGRLHRLAITMPASHEWQDTGLQPDVLATRPVILGATTKLLWKATPVPGISADAILEMRHVADASLATRDRTFTYAAPDERPVVATGQPVRVTGSSVRFPREPGRIEVRIAGADGMRDIVEIAGSVRLELLAPIAGEGDKPLRAPDKLTIESDDHFSPLPALPPNEPPAWRAFRAN